MGVSLFLLPPLIFLLCEVMEVINVLQLGCMRGQDQVQVSIACHDQQQEYYLTACSAALLFAAGKVRETPHCPFQVPLVQKGMDSAEPDGRDSCDYRSQEGIAATATHQVCVNSCNRDRFSCVMRDDSILRRNSPMFPIPCPGKGEQKLSEGC